MEHEGDGDTSCNWHTRYSHQRIGTGTGGLEVWRTSGDHPNYGTIENGQNAEKSPRDLRRFDVTQAPLKDHQLKLICGGARGVIVIVARNWTRRLESNPGRD